MLYKFLLSSLLITTAAWSQQEALHQPTKEDSLIGSLTPEKTWWDIMHYDITIRPDYNSRSLSGKNTIQYKVVTKNHSRLMQIDLVKPLMIDSVIQNGSRLKFRNEGDIWYVTTEKKENNKVSEITIYYSGKPIESKSPPWDGGFVWTTDSLKRPWISVACQYKGASLWYPCKNMLYDEPDKGASLSIITPSNLVAIGNGRLKHKQQHMDSTTTYTWMVTNPINHYGISFYIGSYVNIGQKYNGEKGKLTMNYWVLDYNRQKAENHMIPEAVQAMRSMEHWFGPYPFYEDGFKMVDAPYIGMEHQSAIAYGNNYTKGTYKGNDVSRTGWGKKTDRIIVHEMAHEWFGNSITASDIADRWIQEGFAGMAEELVIADLCGKEAGEEFLAGRYRTIENDKPVIGRYGINEDGSSDGYIKGWAVIHMIQTILNDDAKFLKILRGLNSRFFHSVVTTNQIENYISSQSGYNFSPLFDQYLRTTQVPVLEYSLKNNECRYRFANCNEQFTMPIRINLTNAWIFPTTAWQAFSFKNKDSVETVKVDPNFYLTVKEVK
ncbi:MAG: M1 family metallopeptidase [Flavisolibacter sp.]